MLDKDVMSGIVGGIAAAVFVYFYGRKKKSTPKGKKAVTKTKHADSENEQIYVGNLHYNVQKNTLFDTFKPFGTIREVRIIQNNKTGRSKGFAFIRFKTADQAEKALKMHGRDLYGRSLVVRIAKKRDES